MLVQVINGICDKCIQVVNKAEKASTTFVPILNGLIEVDWLVGRAGFEPAIFAA
jgi:hypothetical protein